jgi:Leucine-rich repeat (LRR) protein
VLKNNKLTALPFDLPPNVQHVDLHSNRLTGTFPAGSLLQLTHLDISKNEFNTFLPTFGAQLSVW